MHVMYFGSVGNSCPHGGECGRRSLSHWKGENTMPKAISIHVGVNEVTSNVFHAPPLHHAEDDAMAMFDLAKKAGFEANWKSTKTGKSSLLLGPDATYSNVTKAVLDAANDLDPGSIFLFTFSGHGDASFLDHPAVPEDGKNETIVLTDHLLFD